MSVDFNIKIGGEAGQGLQTISSALAKTFLNGGYNVFVSHFFLSRIRGGHNFSEVRISDEQINSKKNSVDLLVALDAKSIEHHYDELNEGTVIVLDINSIESITKEADDASYFDVPFTDIAKDISGHKIYSNSVATGAIVGLLCYEFQYLADVLTRAFESKGDDIVQNNINAAKAGYDYAQENYATQCYHMVIPKDKTTNKILVTGNEAIGLGAISGGLQFLSAYPMSPSTGAMLYIADNADKFNIIVEQAEDEIAALNMAIGASFAGARSMVTTSGGGFALMAEALGLAGITETPVVIYLAQRPGPATGLPTMTEQGDLQFVINASQGEFPRCVLAPMNPKDAFYLTVKAFNIAAKYQIPVFLLGDQYLADSSFTVPIFDQDNIDVEHWVLSSEELDEIEEYKRYLITESGISPRALPGSSKHLVCADSDEHDEYGHIDQTIENRIKMNSKRLKKNEGLVKEIFPPLEYGSNDSDITFVGWGSTYGPIKEAVDTLTKKGYHVNMVHFNEVYPLPQETVTSILKDKNSLIAIENNATGQFTKLLYSETGIKISQSILRFDGLPFTADNIIGKLHDMEMI
ncbi:2-oxoacid:acceptor oxidoreductase subunit alpha [Methanosalsum natronophilum]|nr:2-oxoacid:acceptor oxidoreductase subunit alpha [Methanosalsum natronophilum]MCS3924511.1 2-oxoglutarate ferredoxin oxidoreductase subunit alpha [Methanosalsum natronophilum]